MNNPDDKPAFEPKIDYDAILAKSRTSKIQPLAPCTFKRLRIEDYKTQKQLLMPPSLILGRGYNNAHYRVRYREEGAQVSCPYYEKWRSMLKSCFEKNNYGNAPMQVKKRYKGSTVNHNWVYFECFLAWYESFEEFYQLPKEPYEYITKEQAKDIELGSANIIRVEDILGTTEAHAILNDTTPATPEEQQVIDDTFMESGKVLDLKELRTNSAMISAMEEPSDEATTAEALYLASTDGAMFKGDLKHLRECIESGLIVLD